MNRIIRILPLIIMMALVATASAQSAESLYKKGKTAEARQDYITAFEAYRQCYEKKPEDLRYRVSYERIKILASSAHVKKGQEAREAGKLDEALVEFQYAAKIDPSSFVAEQEVRRTKALIDEQQKKPGAEKPSILTSISPITEKLEQAAGPAQLEPINNMPITLKMSNQETRVIYETIGKLSGINILFDPDYTSRHIPNLELNGVTLEDSLQIVAFLSKTFWRPVTGNTIFVAADTTTKRKELESNVIKTFYLSNACAPSDIQDVQTTIRTVLELQKVTPVNSQCALIVRGTPDQIALTEKIIGDIDKSKPEIIVDVMVMEVRRDKLRNLGITPPSSISAQIALANSTTSSSTSTTNPTTGQPTTTTPTTNNPTLNDLANLIDKDISVTIPGATANFLFSDNGNKIIQNPQIRASDGQKASLKIGDRIPVATGSLGNPFAGGTGVGTAGFVNTQFQYIDVGVNIDITPHVHAGREISMKLALEISSVDGSSTIGGVTQPIISQRKVEHDIRLKEGEVNVLGGILQSQDIESVTGLPFLSQIPLLKYLFSSKSKEKIDSEIIFVLVPRIVRSQEINAMNQKAIDIGTGTTISIRENSKPAKAAEPAAQKPAPDAAVTPPMTPPAVSPAAVITPVTTAPATSAKPAGETAENVAKPPATSAPTPPTTKPADKPPKSAEGTASLSFNPPNISHNVGEQFSVDIVVHTAADVHTVPLQINYDSKTLQLISVDNGEYLTQGGNAVQQALKIDVEHGVISVTAARPLEAPGVYGDGKVFTLNFLAKYKGDSVLSINNPSYRYPNPTSKPVPMTAGTANISIH